MSRLKKLSFEMCRYFLKYYIYREKFLTKVKYFVTAIDVVIVIFIH